MHYQSTTATAATTPTIATDATTNANTPTVVVASQVAFSGADINELAVGTTQREQFEIDFKTAMAEKMGSHGVSANDINIISITAGSVVVHFTVTIAAASTEAAVAAMEHVRAAGTVITVGAYSANTADMSAAQVVSISTTTTTTVLVMGMSTDEPQEGSIVVIITVVGVLVVVLVLGALSLVLRYQLKKWQVASATGVTTEHAVETVQATTEYGVETVPAHVIDPNDIPTATPLPAASVQA